jgi:thioredoxin reductase/NAD-dependent dihydropyrimidine dehydrogenase PreA subunit
VSFALLLLVIGCLLLSVLVLVERRLAAARLGETLAARREAVATGSHRARLQHPHIDLSLCIGCGACVRACPEEGVLDLVHGQAVVVHGARCVGHGRCAEACPVGAIAITLGDVKERTDLPALTELESVGTPGLFLAGEVTGYALVRTAIAHGVQVADAVASRAKRPRRVAAVARQVRRAGSRQATAVLEEAERDTIAADLDLIIVGAGPAGLACALRAKELGLRFVVIERDQLGGSVTHYPRRKLVMTQPVHLPLHGRMNGTSWQKEDLVALWQDLARRHQLPIYTGEELAAVERLDDGFEVRTQQRTLRAAYVCLALGRRGTPRRLEVPGEELPKVAYSLIDAASYQGRRCLVVGGGDSAIEAALGLCEQPGNEVTLSYRGKAFTRIKARNDARLRQAQSEGKLAVELGSVVTAIAADRVHLRRPSGEQVLANDDVFVFAGGVPPFDLLSKAGVSFDPEDRPAPAPLVEQGSGLLRALAVACLLALGVLAFALVNAAYYRLAPEARLQSPAHARLAPTSPLGFALGAGATLLMLANLGYLLRRSRLGQSWPGSLRGWMSAHVVTGILALLAVLLHMGFAPRQSAGGRAFWALVVVVAAGAVGRYLYALVPRAANGRELELDEVQSKITAVAGEWQAERTGFADLVRQRVHELAMAARLGHGLLPRLLGALTSRLRLRRTLHELYAEGKTRGIAAGDLRRILSLARRAHGLGLAAARYEDLRGLLASWRWLHRWLALLLVLLAAIHIIVALRYAHLPWPTR